MNDQTKKPNAVVGHATRNNSRYNWLFNVVVGVILAAGGKDTVNNLVKPLGLQVAGTEQVAALDAEPVSEVKTNTVEVVKVVTNTVEVVDSDLIADLNKENEMLSSRVNTLFTKASACEALLIETEEVFERGDANANAQFKKNFGVSDLEAHDMKKRLKAVLALPN